MSRNFDHWLDGALDVEKLEELAEGSGAKRTGIGCVCKATLCRVFYDRARRELGLECMRCGHLRWVRVARRDAVDAVPATSPKM